MKKRWLLLLPIVAVTLAGCSFLRGLIFGDNSDLEPIHYNYPDPVIEPDDVAGRFICKQFSYNLKDVYDTQGLKPLASTGKQKILVVPVQLRGATLANQWTSFKREEIRKCFFGPSSAVGWESVSSFYNKSSYGKLEISGEVADTFVSKYSFLELDGEEHPDRKIVDEFEASTFYNDKRNEYDTNSDGYIDAVSFIYADPIKVSSSDMRWWAFVYANDSIPQSGKPAVVNHYMWASYHFCKIATASNPHGGKYDLDAHTYIHESGHLFGLDDYYSYADNNAYDPSGGQEMHSQNIGDENIYSKLALGWIEPYYVKTDTTVTTKLYASSYSSQANAIIINDNWNETPMDEYIIIEYYSPTVLNQKDSESEYAKNARMFTTSGFRIYHVDSRLVAYNKTGSVSFVKRLDTIDPNYYNFIGASNTPAYPYSKLKDVNEIKNYKLLHMMQAGGVNTFKNGAKGSDADLFKEGSSFVASSAFFTNGTKFNAGNEVGYRISIEECNEADMYGVVKISKL
ncbi:MAG: hypothetical protein IJQ92_01735 [Bacilli bacterium]|nr:hypothetical protein [Bacilli bacterium]